jgi:flagellar biogenesis protein FliO
MKLFLKILLISLVLGMARIGSAQTPAPHRSPARHSRRLPARRVRRRRPRWRSARYRKRVVTKPVAAKNAAPQIRRNAAGVAVAAGAGPAALQDRNAPAIPKGGTPAMPNGASAGTDASNAKQAVSPASPNAAAPKPSSAGAATSASTPMPDRVSATGATVPPAGSPSDSARKNAGTGLAPNGATAPAKNVAVAPAPASAGNPVSGKAAGKSSPPVDTERKAAISPEPSRSSSVLDPTLKSILLILLLGSACAALLAARAWKRRSGALPEPTNQLRHLESISLGANRSIHLVSVMGKLLVIGATPQQVVLIKEITDDSYAGSEGGINSGAFAIRLTDAFVAEKPLSDPHELTGQIQDGIRYLQSRIEEIRGTRPKEENS